jgi:hypothetical protein
MRSNEANARAFTIPVVAFRQCHFSVLLSPFTTVSYLNRAKKLLLLLLLDAVLLADVTGEPVTVPLDATEWTEGARS